MDGDDGDRFWRDQIADWHLQRGMPDCGCDEQTADSDLCPASVRWAEEQVALRGAPDLEGDPDPWDHDTWVAAWGHNATLVVADRGFRLPKPPQGMSWLVTRMLVKGNKAVDIALIRFTETDMATVGRGRTVPEPAPVEATAQKILQDALD